MKRFAIIFLFLFFCTIIHEWNCWYPNIVSLIFFFLEIIAADNDPANTQTWENSNEYIKVNNTERKIEQCRRRRRRQRDGWSTTKRWHRQAKSAGTKRPRRKESQCLEHMFIHSGEGGGGVEDEMEQWELKMEETQRCFRTSVEN